VRHGRSLDSLRPQTAGSSEWVPLRQCDVKEQQCTVDFISKWFVQYVTSAMKQYRCVWS
jgi:hypothetical protein